MRVITLGTFDLFHHGHIRLLQRCNRFAGKGGMVTIGVNSDAFVTRYKGTPPVCPEQSRLASCLAYGFALLHRPEVQDTPEFIERARPNLIVIGSDWARKDYLGQLGITQDWLDSLDISLCYVPYTKGISSTFLRSARD